MANCAYLQALFYPLFACHSSDCGLALLSEVFIVADTYPLIYLLIVHLMLLSNK